MSYEVIGEVVAIPLSEIFLDHDFNCRGWFNPDETRQLGQSIESDGQLAPAIVQPMADVSIVTSKHNFRLLAGHRRYIAIKTWTQIPTINCIIESGLNTQAAKILNFTENLQRKDLDMWQEALALSDTWPGEEIKYIAKMIGKPKRWVQSRLDLLALPDYVQRSAALGEKRGGLSQFDVEKLAGIPEAHVENTFQQMVTAGAVVKNSVSGYNWKTRPRGKVEIKQMIATVLHEPWVAGPSDRDRDVVAATLAWVLKGIKTQEFVKERLGYPKGCQVDDQDKFTKFGLTS